MMSKLDEKKQKVVKETLLKWFSWLEKGEQIKLGLYICINVIRTQWRK